MMKKTTLVWICMSCFIWISCNNDDYSTGTSASSDDTISVNQNIDSQFLPFVESFFTEMEIRGYNFSNDKITMVFVDQLSAPNSSQFCAYGYTNFNGTEGPRVEVIESQSCWNARTYTEKENLIFHELGHALISRGHFTGELPNGMSISIMCTQTCNNYRVYNKYQTEQRSYYLDELGAQGTPQPAWSTTKNFTETLYTDSFDEGAANWLTAISNNNNDESSYTFFIEANDPISPPFSLGIQSNSDAISSQDAYWYAYFDITEFDSCSNIVVRADISVSQLLDGYVAIVVEQVNDSNGTPEHFGRSVSFIESYSSGSQNFEGFTSKSLCLPATTDAVRVWLYLQNTSNAKVLFDNIKIELHE